MTVPFQVQTNALKRKLLFYSFPLYSFITFLSSYACSYLLSLGLPFFFFFLSLLFFFSCHYLPLSLSCPQPSPIRFWFDSNCVQQRGRRGSKAQLADLCLPSGNRRSLLVVLHSSRLRSRRRWLVEFSHWLIC